MRFCSFAMALLLALVAAPLAAQPADASAAVTAVVEQFHAALAAGDSSAAAVLIAEDALMLEAGGVETRSEYVKNHLPGDIEFEKGVSTKRSPVKVTVRGEAAWATSSSEVTGTFQGRAVNFVGVESMVLSREPAGWRIRAIHWSSRSRLPAKP